jgi:integrase
LAIDSYDGPPVAKIALQLAPLVFVRPSELINAEWAEFDLAKAEWRIPKAKMKMKRPHIVPLAPQALALAKNLKGVTGAGRYLFPSPQKIGAPYDKSILIRALRALGFASDEMCAHGFRSIASTLLNEHGHNRDWIERQLAHVPGGVRAAYNYAQHLPERRKMMADWANFLDRLKGDDWEPENSRGL